MGFFQELANAKFPQSYVWEARPGINIPLQVTPTYTPTSDFHFGAPRKKTYRERTLIKRVLCKPPATIIFWKDGSKTVAVQRDGDVIWDDEKGFTFAYIKHENFNYKQFCWDLKHFMSNKRLDEIVAKKSEDSAKTGIDFTVTVNLNLDGVSPEDYANSIGDAVNSALDVKAEDAGVPALEGEAIAENESGTPDPVIDTLESNDTTTVESAIKEVIPNIDVPSAYLVVDTSKMSEEEIESLSSSFASLHCGNSTPAENE